MKCTKSGIKIHQTKHKNNIKQNINFQTTALNQLDLDINNYSLDDLMNLFNIDSYQLDEQIMRNAKQIVLKMHPDKSNLDAKYFRFFTSAYKRLYGIYEFQNKSSNKKSTSQQEDFYDETNKTLLDNLFKNKKEFEDHDNFNTWFNNAFEKHRIDNPLEQGYGEWMKSNDDIIDINEKVTQGNMNQIFEQKKKQTQALTVYTGIVDSFASSFGATSLADGTSADNGTFFTDLKEAYTQTLIPVTEDDYDKIPKYKNVNEYSKHRSSVNIKPLSTQESQRQLYEMQRKQEQESVALAYKLAKDAEKTQQKQNSFWADLKQITGW
jgi:hypothetical protein